MTKIREVRYWKVGEDDKKCYLSEKAAINRANKIIETSQYVRIVFVYEMVRADYTEEFSIMKRAGSREFWVNNTITVK